MSNSKNYNSIVFLTTLSVYLGLVLVGATPSVLAQQAALTQKFEIQNEREIEDDLDKNPDDEDCWDSASQEVLGLVNGDFLSNGILGFLTDLQNLAKIGKYTDGDRFNFQFDYKSTEGGRSRISYLCYSTDDSVILAASKKVENLASSRYYRYDQDLKTNASHSTVSFILENDVLTIKISDEQKSNSVAEITANNYNKAFAIGICSKYVDKPQKIVYQRSKATFENNQVFIVTNLPRASIDELLADTHDAQ